MKKTISRVFAIVFSLTIVFSSLGVCLAFADDPVVPELELAVPGDTVAKGDTITLTATVKNYSEPTTIVWSSSDRTVATVNTNGVVTGKEIGRSVIKATVIINEQELSKEAEICVTRKKNNILSYFKNHNVLSYKYSYKDDYFYTDQYNAWQSNFGFAKIYDLVAPYYFMEYDYVRVHFEYENQDWMVQLWKGQYGLVFFGCEQGIYNKSHSDKEDGVFTFYKCPKDKNDWCKMQTTLYHDQKGDGNYVREFTTPYEENWWSTGFKPGHLRQEEPATELRQVGTLTFRNEDMANFFTDGLIECGFKEANSEENLVLDSFYQDGDTVKYIWQNISEAENTMPIKITMGTLFTLNIFAIIGFVLMMLLATMVMGFVIILI